MTACQHRCHECGAHLATQSLVGFMLVVIGFCVGTISITLLLFQIDSIRALERRGVCPPPAVHGIRR